MSKGKFGPLGNASLPEKQSIREAIEHLLAKNREIRPLCFGPALPIKVEWYSRPYYVGAPLDPGTRSVNGERTNLRRVTLSFESAEEGFLSTQDLDGTCGVFAQVCQTAGMAD